MDNNIEKIEAVSTAEETEIITENNTMTNAHKSKKVYTVVHGVFALLALVLGTLYYRWVFCDEFFGLNEAGTFAFAVVFAGFVTAFAYARKKKPLAETWFLLAVLIAASTRFLFDYHYGIVENITYLVVHMVALLLVASLKESVIDNIVPKGFKACFVAPFASFFALPVAVVKGFFGKLIKTGKKDDRIERIGFVIAGLCVAFPVVVIVLILLARDSFFTGFVGNVFNGISGLSIGDYVNIITILVAMFLFGALYSADRKSEVSPAIDKAVMPSVFVNTVIISLLAVYGVFILAQIDGYAAMIMGKIPEGTTYADFARSGFFSLCAVACINGAVIYAANIFSEKESKSTKNLSVTLVAVTYLLLVTAAVKMGLYISAYGFTEKRIFTIWFMVLLGVIFALALVKLIKKPNFKLSKYAVYVTGAMLIVLCNVDCIWLSDTINKLIGK